MPGFAELVAEGASVPLHGWDFSWFAGRATEERPSWGYARLLGRRMAAASAALDLQTGGGEVLATIPSPPPLLVATESWPPNVEVARRTLAPLRAHLLAVADDSALPLRSAAFDLVSSRHPVDTWWPEVARLLRPGGTYLSQQVGPGTVRELAEAVAGPRPANPRRGVGWIAAEAAAAGLEVLDLRQEALRMVFYDIGAVVHFLRKVVWIVPGFTVERYRDRLLELHERIRAEGPFVTYAQRILVEARRPG